MNANRVGKKPTNESSRRRPVVSSLVASVALSAIGGCATTSQVVPYGKDTYMVAAEDVWGANSSSSMQVKAAREASKFCAGQGKVMRVRNTTQEGTQMWTGTSSSLVFSCISESDAENTRPELKPYSR